MKKIFAIIFVLFLVTACGENKTEQQIRSEADTLTTAQDSLQAEKEKLQREIDSLKALNQKADKELKENGVE